MGCFLGCFGDDKDRRTRKQRIHRPDSQLQQRVGSFQQKSVLPLADQSITETPPPNLVSELRNRPGGEQLSPSPRKRVTFDSNITTYVHYSLYESTDSLPEGNPNVQTEKERNPIISSHPQFEDENSVKSCIVSYPPSHRYHNARDSDDEAEDYSDSDLDDSEDDDDDDEDEDDIDCTSDGREIWPGSTLISSLESNRSAGVIKKAQLLEQDNGTLGSKSSQARNRSDYVNSVLNPVENVTQWKAVKSKGTCFLKSQEENNQSLFDLSVRCDQFKNSNQEIAVDASFEEYIKDMKTMSKG